MSTSAARTCFHRSRAAPMRRACPAAASSHSCPESGLGTYQAGAGAGLGTGDGWRPRQHSPAETSVSQSQRGSKQRAGGDPGEVGWGIREGFPQERLLSCSGSPNRIQQVKAGGGVSGAARQETPHMQRTHPVSDFTCPRGRGPVQAPFRSRCTSLFPPCWELELHFQTALHAPRSGDIHSTNMHLSFLRLTPAGPRAPMGAG